MIELKLPIPFELSPSNVENLENLISFVDKRILDYKILKKTKELLIYHQLKEKEDLDRLLSILDDFLIKLTPAREDDGEVVQLTHNSGIEFPTKVYESLLERGDIFPTAAGYYALGGRFYQLLKRLDKKILEFTKTQKALEVDYPITIPLEVLNQSHFFDRTPQFANFISTIKEDITNISSLSKKIKTGEKDDSWKDNLNIPKHMCRSAVCLNSYPTYRGKTLSKPVILTTVGKVFRNESKQVEGLERMFEFTVRDTIYYGPSEWVLTKLEECFSWYKDLIVQLDLQASIEIATDPFFVDNIKTLQFFQKAEQSKSEIRFFIPDSKKSISVGSLNNHGSHFSKSYEIKLENGEYASTACTGFGLERLVFAILSQHGIEESSWPLALKNFFK